MLAANLVDLSLVPRNANGRRKPISASSNKILQKALSSQLFLSCIKLTKPIRTVAKLVYIVRFSKTKWESREMPQQLRALIYNCITSVPGIWYTSGFNGYQSHTW